MNENLIPPDKPIFPISAVAEHLKVHQRTLRIYDNEKIKNLRKQKGLTQEKLCFESNVSRSHIGMIENAKRDVSLSAIFRLSRALETNFQNLFDFDDLEIYKYSPE